MPPGFSTRGRTDQGIRKDKRRAPSVPADALVLQRLARNKQPVYPLHTRGLANTGQTHLGPDCTLSVRFGVAQHRPQARLTLGER